MIKIEESIVVLENNKGFQKIIDDVQNQVCDNKNLLLMLAKWRLIYDNCYFLQWLIPSSLW